MRATSAAVGRAKAWAPEAGLAALAALVFLGFLGSVELWGKREQRASAEAVDTVEHGRWLVARIQGRPRLEKPPLPRWAIAGVMTLTGRADEWAVRLPSALAAIGTVGLVYGLGRRTGGRAVGLASGLALTSSAFFVAELRQAGNDGPLAFFTTLALYAFWRRLNGEGVVGPVDGHGESVVAGGRGWTLLGYAALGLGFLTKGPIVLVLAGVAVVPSLACGRRLREGLGLLADARGAALFLFLALSWPLPVLADDPNAARVWLLEMGQKTGAAGLGPYRARLPLLADWPWMTAPWGLFVAVAAARPLLGRRGGARRSDGFAWWWAVGNLAMFGLWSVAKPSYYLPCLPAAALLAGGEWVRVCRLARGPSGDRVAAAARRLLGFHWAALGSLAVAGPIVAFRAWPGASGWAAAAGLVLAACVALSVRAWRRGGDASALGPLASAFGALVLIGYGALAPAENDRHGHRALAEALDRALPGDARTVRFFHELDEGLWFYLRGRELAPVPGSQPAYNDVARALDEVRARRSRLDPGWRYEAHRKVFADWARRADRDSAYVLIRADRYDVLAGGLGGLAEPVHRERGLKRNALVLLRLNPPAPAVAGR